MNTSKPAQQQEAIAQLCPACGFCCNGILFADVELQAGDDAKTLASLGLLLSKKGRKLRLSQPCACLDGTLCRIYTDRPVRCRTFECRLLQRVQSGSTEVAMALRTIERARSRAATVRDLLRRLGQNDEHLPLSQRCQKTMAEPYDLAGSQEVIRLRRQLLLAMHGLAQTLELDFLT